MAEQAGPSRTRTASVIIPVGSADPRLERQVSAVLDQSCNDVFDVVLSVNTRDPATIAHVEAIGQRVADRRLRDIDSSSKRGAAHARNVGAAATAAAKLAFCDADDLVHDGWLQALIEGLDQHAAVCGQVIDKFPDARMAAWHPPATPGRLPTFLGRPYLLTGNLAIRREAFEAVGGFDETLTRCEDIAIGWLLQQQGYTIGYAPDAVIDYHHRPGLTSMLRQHYLYGRGMSEVLRRYDMPQQGGRSALGRGMLKPNGQRAQKRTIGGSARRGAIAFGRARGLIGRQRAVVGRRLPREPV
ncbi:MAG: glycosyltransferase [Ilumatobacteraceae bacterium]|nr:glycosyltransferase [Ilumatobacteraceae bacterium]